MRANMEVQAMGSFDDESGPAAAPGEILRIDRRPPRFAPEFEADIKGLYLSMLEDPVPAHLIGILRARLAGTKS